MQDLDSDQTTEQPPEKRFAEAMAVSGLVIRLIEFSSMAPSAACPARSSFVGSWTVLVRGIRETLLAPNAAIVAAKSK